MELLGTAGGDKPPDALLDAAAALLFARHAEPLFSSVPASTASVLDLYPAHSKAMPHLPTTQVQVMTAEQCDDPRWCGADHAWDHVSEAQLVAPSVQSNQGLSVAAHATTGVPVDPSALYSQTPSLLSAPAARTGNTMRLAHAPQFNCEQQQEQQQHLPHDCTRSDRASAVTNTQDQEQQKREQALLKQWTRQRRRVEQHGQSDRRKKPQPLQPLKTALSRDYQRAQESTSQLEASRRTSVILPGMSILPPTYQRRPHIIEIDPRLRAAVGVPSVFQNGATRFATSGTQHGAGTFARRFPSPSFPSNAASPYPRAWELNSHPLPATAYRPNSTAKPSHKPPSQAIAQLHQKTQEPNQPKRQRVSTSTSDYVPYRPGGPKQPMQFGRNSWTDQQHQSAAVRAVDPGFRATKQVGAWVHPMQESLLPSLAFRASDRPATLGDLWDSLLPTQGLVSASVNLHPPGNSRNTMNVKPVAVATPVDSKPQAMQSDWYYPSSSGRKGQQPKSVNAKTDSTSVQAQFKATGDAKKPTVPPQQPKSHHDGATPVQAAAVLVKSNGKPLSNNRLRELQKKVKRKERRAQKQQVAQKSSAQNTSATDVTGGRELRQTLTATSRKRALPLAPAPPVKLTKSQLREQFLHQARMTLLGQQHRPLEKQPPPTRTTPTVVRQSKVTKRQRLSTAKSTDSDPLKALECNSSQHQAQLREDDLTYGVDGVPLMMFPPAALQPVNVIDLVSSSKVGQPLVDLNAAALPVAELDMPASASRQLAPKRSTRKRKMTPPVESSRSDSHAFSELHDSTIDIDSPPTVEVNPTATAESSHLPTRPRAQPETVMIFCKRDFFRFQAGLLWRKYQEIKRKRDSTLATVVARRTRYLNARYQSPDQPQATESSIRQLRPTRQPVSENQTEPHEVVDISDDDGSSDATSKSPVTSVASEEVTGTEASRSESSGVETEDEATAESDAITTPDEPTGDADDARSMDSEIVAGQDVVQATLNEKRDEEKESTPSDIAVPSAETSDLVDPIDQVEEGQGSYNRTVISDQSLSFVEELVSELLSEEGCDIAEALDAAPSERVGDALQSVSGADSNHVVATDCGPIPSASDSENAMGTLPTPVTSVDSSQDELPFLDAMRSADEPPQASQHAPTEPHATATSIDLVSAMVAATPACEVGCAVPFDCDGLVASSHNPEAEASCATKVPCISPCEEPAIFVPHEAVPCGDVAQFPLAIADAEGSLPQESTVLDASPNQPTTSEHASELPPMTQDTCPAPSAPVEVASSTLGSLPTMEESAAAELLAAKTTTPSVGVSPNAVPNLDPIGWIPLESLGASFEQGNAITEVEEEKIPLLPVPAEEQQPAATGDGDAVAEVA